MYIVIYPIANGIESFRLELLQYKSGKGSIWFPIDKPPPYELIREIVKFKVVENIKNEEDKLEKKK